MRRIAAAMATSTILVLGGNAVAVAAPPVGGPADWYVAKVNNGRTQSLVVASRTTGAVVRVAASGTVSGFRNVFEDVDLAPDGTVWAVRGSDADLYAARLYRYAPGRPGVLFMPYVVAARVSPDGQRIAVTVLSPDADHDGRGTASVRVGSVRGGKFTTLTTTTFPVDKKTGNPTMEITVPRVAGWIGSSRLAVQYGCCDSGAVALIPANVPTAMSSWRVFDGDGSTQAVGVLPGGRALVVRDRETGDGAKVPMRTVGYDAYAMSPSGTVRLVWSGKPKDDSARAWIRLPDAAITATKAVPLAVSRVRYPFKGQGFVTAAYV